MAQRSSEYPDRVDEGGVGEVAVAQYQPVARVICNVLICADVDQAQGRGGGGPDDLGAVERGGQVEHGVQSGGDPGDPQMRYRAVEFGDQCISSLPVAVADAA